MIQLRILGMWSRISTMSKRNFASTRSYSYDREVASVQDSYAVLAGVRAKFEQ